jgi:branched-chain amino acid transport system permease protein
VLGLIIERGLLRLVCDRDEVIVVLVTFAASLILEDMILLIWGTQSYPLYQPLAAAGNFEVGLLVLSGYDMGLIALAVALAIAAHWALKYTRYGRLLTVVIFDRETAAAFGINVTVVFTVTFIIGAMLGALGGAVMAPKISVTLGIGVEVIVLAFAVVATGGMGSIEGALVGALIVGLCRAAAVHLVPQLELFVIYAVMALVLVFRPYGLFTQVAPRKI